MRKPADSELDVADVWNAGIHAAEVAYRRERARAQPTSRLLVFRHSSGLALPAQSSMLAPISDRSRPVPGIGSM
jgi:hypothetical protein